MLGENGRKRVVEELNWERSIAQFRDTLCAKAKGVPKQGHSADWVKGRPS
jgi:hypothetical protein